MLTTLLEQGIPDMEALTVHVNKNESLIRRGRHINTTFMVEIEDLAYFITITEGRVTAVDYRPDMQPKWSFAMRAPRESWENFWLPVPPPGFNDLLALVKHGGLRIEGDMHMFMANLLYFKNIMALLRFEENLS